MHIDLYDERQRSLDAGLPPRFVDLLDNLCRLRRDGERQAADYKANFKTLKYFPAFPDRFASIGDAKRFYEAISPTTTLVTEGTPGSDYTLLQGFAMARPTTSAPGKPICSRRLHRQPEPIPSTPDTIQAADAAWINEAVKEKTVTEFVA
ncbi:hypothetical protein ACIHDR_47705 [Nocardia sp. NPDC052278]|uniref:hypothetical protein n=1 Tax=unclassified Nocardia TaxID=2637762 RepID=UPI00368BC9B9